MIRKRKSVLNSVKLQQQQNSGHEEGGLIQNDESGIEK